MAILQVWGKNQGHFCNQCNHAFNLKCFYQIPLTWWKPYIAYLFTYFPLFVSATGNELEMQGVEIQNNILLSEKGNPIEYNFQEPDYDDIDSDYIPGYRKCQAQCNGW